jgi:hypothetical protein
MMTKSQIRHVLYGAPVDMTDEEYEAACRKFEAEKRMARAIRDFELLGDHPGATKIRIN